jgi:peptidoglycan hydrolase CwlO-like protein
LQVLRREEEKFARAVARQEDVAIDAKNREIADLQTSIQGKEQQIQQLQAKITQQKEQIKTLQTEITDAQTKVETTKNNFIASYNSLAGQIAADVERMKKYLNDE